MRRPSRSSKKVKKAAEENAAEKKKKKAVVKEHLKKAAVEKKAADEKAAAEEELRVGEELQVSKKLPIITPVTEPLSHRERLIHFYRQQNPRKLGTVDAILAKYRGHEETLFQKLARKYNLSAGELEPRPALDGAALLDVPEGTSEPMSATVKGKGFRDKKEVEKYQEQLFVSSLDSDYHSFGERPPMYVRARVKRQHGKIVEVRLECTNLVQCNGTIWEQMPAMLPMRWQRGLADPMRKALLSSTMQQPG